MYQADPVQRTGSVESGSGSAAKSALLCSIVGSHSASFWALAQHLPTVLRDTLKRWGGLADKSNSADCGHFGSDSARWWRGRTLTRRLIGMPDNLLSPKPEKTPGNPWLSWPMIALALLIGGYFLAMKSIESRSVNLHFIFHQTANGWEQVRTPAGYPDMLRVTSGGTVWVRTWGKSA